MKYEGEKDKWEEMIGRPRAEGGSRVKEREKGEQGEEK